MTEMTEKPRRKPGEGNEEWFGRLLEWEETKMQAAAEAAHESLKTDPPLREDYDSLPEEDPYYTAGPGWRRKTTEDVPG